MKAIKSNVNERHAVPNAPQLGVITIEEGCCYYVHDSLADLLVELGRAELVDVSSCDGREHGEAFYAAQDFDLDESGDEQDDGEGDEPPADDPAQLKTDKPWKRNK